jgi:hypothetical protein
MKWRRLELVARV